LLLGAVEGHTVIVGLDIGERNRDVFTAHSEADIENHDIDGAVLVENEVTDLADVAVLQVVDVEADPALR
jgi:hypothetical protein